MQATKQDVLKRLAYIEGHLKGIRKMVDDDKYCVECGHEDLEAACTCGRAFDYEIPETGRVHCPRCGKSFRGKSPEYDG